MNRSSVTRALARSLSCVLALALLAVAAPASAAGTFKLKSTEVQEVSGAWHLFVTIELPKAPPTAHTPLRFLFTKTAVLERALVDGHSDPVVNRTSLQGQNPSVESLDVDFADPRGKIFKSTRFDFGLTRARGYEAGEYKVQLRTSDGADVGGTATLVLKGDNPVVDRRSITFNAKDPGIKKIGDGKTADPNAPPKVDESYTPPSNEVEAVGTAAPFISPDAYNKTPEEEVKERPKGCGCSVPGTTNDGAPLASLAAAGLGLAVAARRRRATHEAAPRA